MMKNKMRIILGCGIAAVAALVVITIIFATSTNINTEITKPSSATSALSEQATETSNSDSVQDITEPETAATLPQEPTETPTQTDETTETTEPSDSTQPTTAAKQKKNESTTQKSDATQSTTAPTTSTKQQQNNNEKPPETTPKNDTPTISVPAYEKRVVDLVNEIRVQYGLSPLTLNANLSDVARLKSQDLKDKDYFDHISPTYGSPSEMMTQFGITYSFAGENIAMGYPTPEAVVNGWMNSEGHRANILTPSFTQIGVGYVASGNYWTQMFIG